METYTTPAPAPPLSPPGSPQRRSGDSDLYYPPGSLSPRRRSSAARSPGSSPRRRAKTEPVTFGLRQGEPAPEPSPNGWPERAGPPAERVDSRTSTSGTSTGTGKKYSMSIPSKRAELGNARLIKPYAKVLARFPGCCFLLSMACAIAICVVGIIHMPIVIEPDFGSFLKTDVPSSIMWDAYLTASNYEDTGTGFRRLAAEKTLTLTLYYAGSDLFSPICIEEIAMFEFEFRELATWRQLCALAPDTHRQFCDTGITFAGYIMPEIQFPQNSSSRLTPTNVTFSGKGYDRVPPEVAVQWASMRKTASIMLPSPADETESGSEDNDDSVNARSDSGTNALRSVFHIRLAKDAVADATAAWRRFVRSEFIPVVESRNRAVGGCLSQIAWSASDVDGLELYLALESDMYLAVGSIVAVFVYLVLHLQSILMSFFGIFAAFAAVPLAYVLCAATTGSTTITFASFLAVFLMIGFGCDIVFVFTDFWRDSLVKHDNDEDRLAWVIYNAGKASLATTATTALSFFANLASVIRALRQLGFFMGLCCMLAWLLITIVYPPLCLFHENQAEEAKITEKILGCLPRCCDFGQEHAASRASVRGAVRRSLMQRMAIHIFRHKLKYAVLPVSLIIAGFSFAIFSFTAAFEGISLFPDHHNKAQLDKLQGRFSNYAMSDVIATSLGTCTPQDLPGDTDGTCVLPWCAVRNVSLDREAKSNASHHNCACFRRDSDVCGRATMAITVMMDDEHLDRSSESPIVDVFNYFDEERSKSSQALAWPPEVVNGGSMFTAVKAKKLNSVLSHDWVTGGAVWTAATRLTATFTRRDISGPCDWHELCFCNGWRCELDANWSQTKDFVVRKASTRRLADQLPTRTWSPVDPSKRGNVKVLFGIHVDTNVQLVGSSARLSDSWSFMSSFDMADVWSQRALIKFCNGVAPELKVYKSWCWMKEFQLFVNENNLGRFPVASEDFHNLALSFIQSGSGRTTFTKYVWVEEGKLRAMYASFIVDHNKFDMSSITAYKHEWDKYTNAWNLEAQPISRGALHVSTMWVEQESLQALLWSAIVTLAILLGLAFVGVLVFTMSLVLSLFVVAATVGVILGLTFFITVVMGWGIGLIETIAVVYFIGYAVTYSLHVCHSYAHKEALREELQYRPMDANDERRLQRTLHSLKSIGGAALGSSITTSAAALFLLFGTLTIFTKLGCMCLVVSILSILTALGPLPACLMICGPLNPGQCGWRRKAA